MQHTLTQQAGINPESLIGEWIRGVSLEVSICHAVIVAACSLVLCRYLLLFLLPRFLPATARRLLLLLGLHCRCALLPPCR